MCSTPTKTEFAERDMLHRQRIFEHSQKTDQVDADSTEVSDGSFS